MYVESFPTREIRNKGIARYGHAAFGSSSSRDRGSRGGTSSSTSALPEDLHPLYLSGMPAVPYCWPTVFHTGPKHHPRRAFALGEKPEPWPPRERLHRPIASLLVSIRARPDSRSPSKGGYVSEFTAPYGTQPTLVDLIPRVSTRAVLLRHLCWCP